MKFAGIRLMTMVAVGGMVVTLVLMSGCDTGLGGGGGGNSGTFSCTYEQRRTSCSSLSFGSWEAECSPIDFELRDDLTPEGFCQEAYTGSDTECAGACCINFEFRNTQTVAGLCS